MVQIKMEKQMLSKLVAVLFFVILPTTLVIPDNCKAEQFVIDGYSVAINWKQSGKKMEVWGGVQKGRSCRQLNLSIFLQNSQDPGLAHMEAAIKNYNANGRNSYEAYDTVYQNVHDRKYWHVDQVYVNCLQ
jgi:hypothetical protein